jgi:hypothetical protein
MKTLLHPMLLMMIAARRPQLHKRARRGLMMALLTLSTRDIRT